VAASALSTTVRLQLALSFFAFIVIGATDGALGVLLPSIRNQYNIDKATVGFVFLAGTSGYLTAAFLSGPLADKLGRKLFMILGALGLVVGGTIVASVPAFPVLLLAFVCFGFGVAVLDAGLNAYIAGLPNNTSLLNYLHAFYGFGALLGPLLASGVLAAAWNWQVVYYLWTAFGLTLAVAFGVLFPRRDPASEEHSDVSGGVLAAALRMRVVWLGAVFLLVYVGAEVTLGSWSYTFLTEERGQEALLSGWAVSGYWLGLTLGRVVLGKMSEKVGNRRLIELCLMGTVVGVLLIWLVPVGWAMAVGLWIAGFSLGPIFPTTIALMSNLVPARILPTAVGFLASFGAMGAALFPAGAGALAENVGLWAILPYVIILTLVMMGLWVVLVAYRPREREMAEPGVSDA
jgi:fucose permease